MSHKVHQIPLLELQKPSILSITVVSGMKLMETWAKSPFLKNASLLIVGECVKTVYPDLLNKLSKGKIVLYCCPEAERISYGKIATIIRCAEPKEISVLTMEGSYHCLGLHGAVNEALFISKSKIPCSHFVIVDGKLVEISEESIRVSRYLHLVQKAVERYPELLKELEKFSVEHRWSICKDSEQEAE